ncbi:hypothetical protein ACVIKO_007272 [Rhizobium ruizarguesonis]
MGKLRALLASVEAGARCLEAGTVLGSAGKCRNRRRSTRVEPQPGIGDRRIAAADEPGAVALSGRTAMAAVRDARSGTFSLRPRNALAQSSQV